MRISELASALLTTILCATTSVAGPRDEPEKDEPKKDGPEKLLEPRIQGRPSFSMLGQELVLPEHVEKSPEIYRGAIGETPLALIRAGNKVVGEIFAAPLPKDAVSEADGMAASVKNNEAISLVKRETRMDDDKKIEVTTIKLDIESPLGRPLILYSLYYPMGGEGSATFKLATAESNFAATLPYLEAMLGLTAEKAEKAANDDKEGGDKKLERKGKPPE